MKHAIGKFVVRVAAFGLFGYLSFSPRLPAQQVAEIAAPAAQSAKHRPSLRQGPPLHVNDAVGELHIRGLSATAALQDISRKANVVIGVEATTHNHDKAVQFDFPGGTVATLIDAFVAKAPDYRWQNDAGIIHVFRSGKHVPLADLELNYPGAHTKTRFGIWRDLHRRPEYVAWMKSSGCHPVDRMNPLHFRFDSGPITIPQGRMTVSQLLDQEATQSGEGFWAVLQSDPSNPVCTATIIDWSLP